MKDRYSAIYQLTYTGYIVRWVHIHHPVFLKDYNDRSGYSFYTPHDSFILSNYRESETSDGLFYNTGISHINGLQLIMHESNPFFNLYLLADLNINCNLVAKIFRLINHEIS